MALRMCLSLVNRQALECNSKMLFGLLIPDQPACIEAASINLNSSPGQSSEPTNKQAWVWQPGQGKSGPRQQQQPWQPCQSSGTWPSSGAEGDAPSEGPILNIEHDFTDFNIALDN